MQVVSGIDILQGQKSIPLAERTTMLLGGIPEVEVRVWDFAKIDALPGIIEKTALPVKVLGAGSNILAKEGVLPLCALTVESGLKPEVTGTDGELTLVRCGADIMLPVLLSRLAGLGLSGLSGLAGIPGSVGGAILMNAGSFGTEIWNRVRSVQVFSPSLGLVELPPERFSYGYRYSQLKDHEGWYLILSATFALEKESEESVRKKMRDCIELKKAGQPLGQPSAGCVFKNPDEKISAGRLLDEAGMKGERAGGMMFSEVHANFMINTGGGLFRDALELIETARAKVLGASGWKLDLEVRVWS